MRYEEFKEAIREELLRHPEGLSWAELKSRLQLPYSRPCPTWIGCMEAESGLTRRRGTGRSLIWLLTPDQQVAAERDRAPADGLRVD